MAELTFYPEAHPETSSVDGNVSHVEADLTWSALRNAAGTAFEDTGEFFNCVNITSDPTENTWQRIVRGILLFDTSLISNRATITAAILTLYGRDKSDQGLGITPNINIYSSNPESNNELRAGDYDSLGVIPMCDTPITYANFAVSTTIPQANAFVINAWGLLGIKKGIGAVTKIGTKNASYDVASVPPTWASGISATLQIYATEKGGSFRPKLVVTFSIVIPLVNTDTATDITSTTATLNGEITHAGGEDCDERGFNWGLTPSTVTDNDWTESGSFAAGTFSHGITGLVADATYYFRAKAHNSAGWGYGRLLTLQGASVYPTDLITRVTSITHRYDRGVYNMELGLGDVTAGFGVPEVDTEVKKSYEPKEEEPLRIFPDIFPTQEAYIEWLKSIGAFIPPAPGM